MSDAQLEEARKVWRRHIGHMPLIPLPSFSPDDDPSEDVQIAMLEFLITEDAEPERRASMLAAYPPALVDELRQLFEQQD